MIDCQSYKFKVSSFLFQNFVSLEALKKISVNNPLKVSRIKQTYEEGNFKKDKCRKWRMEEWERIAELTIC